MKNNNFKNGHNIRSKFWQDYKKSISDLPSRLFNIAVGCMLGEQVFFNLVLINIKMMYLNKNSILF